VTRATRDRSIGNTKVLAAVDAAKCDGNDSELLITEVRRQVFRHAAKEIQPEFAQETWQAFWLTAVEGSSIDSVSNQLGKSKGSIYAARSRVMKRLKEKVQELQLVEKEDSNE